MTKADWLRSEIEKLERMEQEPHDSSHVLYGDTEYNNHAVVYGFNQALTSIITRYKEELLELEKGV